MQKILHTPLFFLQAFRIPAEAPVSSSILFFKWSSAVPLPLKLGGSVLLEYKQASTVTFPVKPSRHSG